MKNMAHKQEKILFFKGLLLEQALTHTFHFADTNGVGGGEYIEIYLLM